MLVADLRRIHALQLIHVTDVLNGLVQPHCASRCSFKLVTSWGSDLGCALHICALPLRSHLDADTASCVVPTEYPAVCAKCRAAF